MYLRIYLKDFLLNKEYKLNPIKNTPFSKKIKELPKLPEISPDVWQYILEFLNIEEDGMTSKHL